MIKGWTERISKDRGAHLQQLQQKSVALFCRCGDGEDDVLFLLMSLRKN